MVRDVKTARDSNSAHKSLDTGVDIHQTGPRGSRERRNENRRLNRLRRKGLLPPKAAVLDSAPPLTVPSYPDAGFGPWFSSFVGGEGYFRAEMREKQLSLSFGIKLRADDLPALQRIHRNLRVGNVGNITRPTPTADVRNANPNRTFCVGDRAQLWRVIVAHFDAFPLQEAKKARDYAPWRALVELANRYQPLRDGSTIYSHLGEDITSGVAQLKAAREYDATRLSDPVPRPSTEPSVRPKSVTCTRGHLWAANLFSDKDGWRKCRSCRREDWRRDYQKKLTHAPDRRLIIDPPEIPPPAVYSDPHLGWDLTGLTDGEGCFSAIRNGKNSVLFKFSILLRADDEPWLLSLRDRLRAETGGLSRNKVVSLWPPRRSKFNAKPLAELAISHRHELLRVIVPHFDAYPLVTKKARDYETWRALLLLTLRYNDQRSGEHARTTLFTSPLGPEVERLLAKLKAGRRYDPEAAVGERLGRGATKRGARRDDLFTSELGRTTPASSES
jgi:hypothetical protein